MSIKNKLIIIFLVSTIIPMLIVGALGFLTAQKFLEQREISALETIADLKVDQIEKFITERRGDVTTARNSLELVILWRTVVLPGNYNN